MSRRMVRYVVGLMSGTSCDGVDAALVEIGGRGTSMKVRFIGHYQRAYPKDLRSRLLSVMAPAQTTTQELCDLNARVGQEFAAACLGLLKEMAWRRTDVDFIGSHGQTICHLPPSRGGRGRRPVGSTLQIGNPAIIAAQTRLPVMSDFRQADVALGGQGAPLVPWTDYVLLRDSRRSRIIQNIGGIANLTYLPASGKARDVIAFDTGPGNMIIDELVRRVTHGRTAYDRGGRRGLCGKVIPALLKQAMVHPFFKRRPPKSCGREQFGSAYVDTFATPTMLADHGNDLIATATALTAQTIVGAYRRFLPKYRGRPRLDEVFLCGGGSQNGFLVSLLKRLLPEVSWLPIDLLGIPYQAKEAVSFAILATACVDRVASNLPQVTGASRPAILGQMTVV